MIAPSAVTAVLVCALAALLFATQELAARLAQSQSDLDRANARLAKTDKALAAARAELGSGAQLAAALAPAPNPPFVLAEAERQARHPPVMTADDSIERLEANWSRHLNETTPLAYQRLPSDVRLSIVNRC